ncbi:TPA_asm: hypothetical protein [Altiarchaeum virus]|nr:TPA_asm: hypothetical protein [Altiarchaeum virus]
MGYAITTFAIYIEQAINTKEDYEVLNGLFMGRINRAFKIYL